VIVRNRVPVRVDFAGAWTDVGIFAQGAGGAVVNATIDRYVGGRLEVSDGAPPSEGIHVSYSSDLPSGSGLGTSAALNVCWLSLIESQIDPTTEHRERIAELAYRLEEILGILGGKQDQYAAALGGFNFLTFGETVGAERLSVSQETVIALENRLVLCYTGKSRLSGNIHESVWGAFRAGVTATVNALYALRDGAVKMREALLAGRVEEFGTLIGESWVHQKSLHASVTNEMIDRLFERALAAGAISGKACGAGGGGCLLFFTAPDKQDSVAEALSQAGAQIIPFHFEFEGLRVWKEE
jgi:D-glycero-alpha-D-manno-heptose-7-phosphate kinase